MIHRFKRCPSCGKRNPAKDFHVRTIRSGPRAGYRWLASRCRACNVAYRLDWTKRQEARPLAYRERARAQARRQARAKAAARRATC